MSETELPRDHFVSRGYQQNFASPDKRVTVISVASGRVVDAGRPIKSNFREQGFTTFLEAGVPNDLLEKAFVSVEKRVLNEIRSIGINRCGPQQKADVANLFAIHLVRSPAFKDFHRDIGDRFRAVDVPDFANNPEYIERFEAFEGRPPTEAELLELALRAYDELASDPMSLVMTMIRQHDAIAEKLNGFHLQVVALADSRLPGFVIGDTPVVHADLRSGRYGFRDRLALGDANFIIGPLSRTTAACFSARPLRPELIRTRKRVDAINAEFLRAASSEVACHPEDARAVRQAHTRLDRLPPSILTG
ncbi:DUF4238 domain-containing protein [Nocardioides caldifontis]|uniref:DUF4238 domain-containing protein n=1 Tax=Nocardioides caldifontis TaxID=2588938 RepID=UPI001396BF8D|nr:DUF4238 domain-containing protein [Nocardioides caldifontis]